MPFSLIEEAVVDFRVGKYVIVLDDYKRENEGDLIIAADFATPAAINFLTKQARGLVCLAMSPGMVDRLGLPGMVPPEANNSGFGTNFTISVEARRGVTTGISAHDRARTIAVLIDPGSTLEDLVMPGHMFPLRAQPGGVLARPGHTEASVDLARLAGLTPAAVICEVMAEDGSMARLPELEALADRYGLKIISIEAMARYLQERNGSSHTEPLTGSLQAHRSLPEVVRVASADLPTRYGSFRITAYHDWRGGEHLLLSHGDLVEAAPLVRIHSECVTGDLLGSLRCDCGDQLQAALRRIAELGAGLLVYLRQEGRGIGLVNKIRAYALQDRGLDTVEANLALGFPPDGRGFGLAAAILKDQGIRSVRLMTNNLEKVTGLQSYGIQVVERLPHQFGLRAENETYLRVKVEKLDHKLVL